MYSFPWADAKGERFAPRKTGVAAAATAAVSRNRRREMRGIGMNLLLNNCPVPSARRISHNHTTQNDPIGEFNAEWILQRLAKRRVALCWKSIISTSGTVGRRNKADRRVSGATANLPDHAAFLRLFG
jgi:hypothetical protein